MIGVPPINDAKPVNFRHSRVIILERSYRGALFVAPDLFTREVIYALILLEALWPSEW